MGRKKWTDDYFNKVIRQTKPRNRQRSVVIPDGLDKQELRQNRRQNTKKEIEDALELDTELLEEFDDYNDID